MKRGAGLGPQDFLWIGGILIAIALLVFGNAFHNHDLTGAVVWVTVAYSALLLLFRLRKRHRRHRNA